MAMVNIDIEKYLDDCSDQSLIEELKRRGYRNIKTETLKEYSELSVTYEAVIDVLFGDL